LIVELSASDSSLCRITYRIGQILLERLRRKAVSETRGKEGEGVLAGALQSEREEETRDRAERGSVVRGSDQASVAPERILSPD
jgi:hypothetical protein